MTSELTIFTLAASLPTVAFIALSMPGFLEFSVGRSLTISCAVCSASFGMGLLVLPDPLVESGFLGAAMFGVWLFSSIAGLILASERVDPSATPFLDWASKVFSVAMVGLSVWHLAQGPEEKRAAGAWLAANWVWLSAILFLCPSLFMVAMLLWKSGKTQ